VNYNEPDHIRMLRETLQKFVEKEMPRELARQWDEQNEYPAEVFSKLAQLGVTGMTMDERHGGSGRDIQATMVVIEELAKRSMAVAVPYIMCTCYAGMTIAECASAEQQARLLPRVASGELMFAYGLTEPDVGADLASVQTIVTRDGDELIISGSKRFVSGAEICDYIYTLACSTPDGERYKNLSFVLIPPDSAGVTIERIATLGIHGAATTDVTFNNVRVPLEALMGGEAGWNNGWDMLAGPCLDVEKLEVAALALGVGAAAVEDAWEYSQERQQFGKPICTYQSIRHKLADMQTQLHAARLMMQHAVELVQQRHSAGVETSMTKMFTTEVTKALALECQTIMGAYGYVKEFDCERYVREAIGLPIFGGSTAIHLNNISSWLGLPKK